MLSHTLLLVCFCAPDMFSKQERSRIMSHVKAKDTRLERRFIHELLKRGDPGFRFHCGDLPGKPDITHDETKIAIFVDSCFWHGCKRHLRRPESNQEYWEGKIRRNRARDRRVTNILKSGGWRVVRIWEHSVRKERSLKWWATRIHTLIDERAAEIE